jgi:hypothetical protein
MMKWCVSLAVGLLVGCQAPLVVLVSPDVTDLVPSITAAVKTSGVEATVVTETNRWPSGAEGLRVTTTPGWNLPAEAPPAAPAVLPKDFDSTYQTAPALAALAGGPGSVSAIPLFFDVWGTTTFAPNPKAKVLPAIRHWQAGGSRPGFRQAAVFLWGAAPPSAPAAQWFSSPAPPALAKAVAAVAGKPEWVPNNWRFSQADLLGAYRPEAPLVFYETYRDYEKQRVTAARRFQPLTMGTPRVVAGIVVFTELRGHEPARWQALLGVLASATFQKTVGLTQPWLPANLQAPDIDSEGAAARNVVKMAARFFPTSDRLPDPMTARDLPTSIQLAFDQLPAGR